MSLKHRVKRCVHRLLGYSQKVFEEYIANAPSKKNFASYHVARDVDSMDNYLKAKMEGKPQPAPLRS